eukprot:TRINITY_DN1474_c0_g1_i2.p1 TRINITY_DN1474_c0_g1~~TRINITY_DN1474_c0_g1_i2.p1  ORF type:complete len:292 (-),score=39.67 TRINITY_DN1474_c0_g1_i2:97-972(-)
MVDLFAGATSGLIAALICHPFDTVRTQTACAPNLLGANVFAATWKIYKAHGAGSLFRGFPAVAAFTTPANALYFDMYARTGTYLRAQRPPLPDYTIDLISGIVANLSGLAIWVPQDVIKSCQQVTTNEGEYRSATQTARTIVRSEGITGLWRGLGASVLLYTPLCGLFFVFYEESKRLMARIHHKPTSALSTPERFFAGLGAATMAAILTTPIDVARTRLQVRGATTWVQKESNSTIPILRALFRGKGLVTVLQCMPSRILAVAPNFALTITLWESMRAVGCRISECFDVN